MKFQNLFTFDTVSGGIYIPGNNSSKAFRINPKYSEHFNRDEPTASSALPDATMHCARETSTRSGNFSYNNPSKLSGEGLNVLSGFCNSHSAKKVFNRSSEISETLLETLQLPFPIFGVDFYCCGCGWW